MENEHRTDNAAAPVGSGEPGVESEHIYTMHHCDWEIRVRDRWYRANALNPYRERRVSILSIHRTPGDCFRLGDHPELRQTIYEAIESGEQAMTVLAEKVHVPSPPPCPTCGRELLTVTVESAAGISIGDCCRQHFGVA